MHEKAPMIQAQHRERLGSKQCERLRKAGGLPAVVYGRGKQPTAISLNAREALAHIYKGEKVFRLDFPGQADQDEGQIVLLKDLQFDYLGTNIVHADFVRVSLTDRVRTRVPIHLIGEAKGLKQSGAILMHPTNEIEVECVLTELPDYFEVNINELDVGHAITAGEVKLPTAGMKLVTDSHSIVAQIVIQQEITAAEATPAGAEAAQPEVITAKKPEEGAAAGKDGKAAAPGKDGKAAAPAKDAKAAAPAKDAKKG